MKCLHRNSIVIILLLALLLNACGSQSSTSSQGSSAAPTKPPVQNDATDAEPVEDTPVAEPVEDTPVAESVDSSESSIAPVPAVLNVEEAQAYSGTTINYYSGQIGVGSELDNLLIEQFAHETGITVNFVPKSDDTTEDYIVYETLFNAQSSDIDVLALDIIWPASFADHLVDLSTAMQAEAKEHFPGIIENSTVDGRIIAMPQFGDFGMLYYRTDLLEQYGFANPPTTWDELETMASTIQEGERESGNANFVGFVFQGAAYEGGTCNALEWIASHGGSIVEDDTVTIDSDATRQALERAQAWVGTIAPETVVSFREEDARQLFQSGDAAFMRNWPYAYAVGQDPESPIAGRFDVAPLPHANDGDSVGTVGGWQLAVSAYSKNPEAAIAFVRYLTSPDVQTWRAIEGAYVPTIRSVSEDPEVIAALPFLQNLQSVVRIARPSRETGANYNQASEIIFNGTNDILRGADVQDTLTQMSTGLETVRAKKP